MQRILNHFSKLTRAGAALTLAASVEAIGAERHADLQFFGDLYVAPRMLAAGESGYPSFLKGVEALLASSAHNIVNFEGVAGESLIPLVPKRHLLRMPAETPALLAAAGIRVATLANNHAMDFGSMGLFETRAALAAAGIVSGGAGRDAREALAPIYLTAGGRGICLLAFTRTLPEAFWAGEASPGTAFADYPTTSALVRGCVDSGLFTVAIFHWGREMTTELVGYQRALGRLVIDAGGDAVIGHHPHVVQEVEFYKGRPIFYSLGNFAFGSLPGGSAPQGMAVRIELASDIQSPPTYEIVPLKVDNTVVNFAPRPLIAGEKDPIAFSLSKAPGCRFQAKSRSWRCTAPARRAP